MAEAGPPDGAAAGRPGPLRTCVGCRSTRRQDELVRVAWDGAALVVSRTARGRGAWLCRDTAASCCALGRRRRAFPRALRAEVPADAVEALEAALGRRPGGAASELPPPMERQLHR